MRGIGWSFGTPAAVPPHPHTSASRPAFAARTLAHGLLSLAIFDGAHHAVQLLHPTTLGHPDGGSVFNPELPPLSRALDALRTTLLSGLVFYYSLELMHSVLALLALALGGAPAAWPPFSIMPWTSTSVARFWGRAWHQTFRRSFLALGGALLQRLLGVPGMWVGAFGASALMHDVCVWAMGRGTGGWRVQAFFWAMGAGCALERAFRAATGVKAGGVGGWCWTMGWTLG
jgi:hypothetical protein